MTDEKKISLKDLSAHPGNPRRISPEQLKMLEKSLKEFGDLSGIIFNRQTGHLIGGHQRLKVLPPDTSVVMDSETSGHILIDADRFHVRFVDWDQTKEKAANIAANQHGGEFDIPALSKWVIELKELNIDMDLLGFDPLELSKLTTVVQIPGANEDDVPAIPKETIAKRGDVWALGRHRLMCGDSTSIDDVDKLMAGEKAQMIFTDPPWNVNYGANLNPAGGSGRERTILNDHMDVEKWKAFTDAITASLFIASKPGAAIYLVMSAQEWPVIDASLRATGFHWSSTIIWAKDRLVMSRKDYHTQYEPIWYGWNGDEARLVPMEDRKQSDLWQIARPSKSELHPTTKPVELVERALNNSSLVGGLILDLFGGSGSTLIAADKNQRRANLMELDPKYCDVIIKRYQDYSGQKAELL